MTKITARLPESLATRLREISRLNGLPQSELVALALAEWPPLRSTGGAVPVKNLLHHVEPFVRVIMDAPLPGLPGQDAAFYAELTALRVTGACTCCAALVDQVRTTHGEQAADEARAALEPIRARLLAAHPEHADLLERSSWLAVRH